MVASTLRTPRMARAAALLLLLQQVQVLVPLPLPEVLQLVVVPPPLLEVTPSAPR